MSLDLYQGSFILSVADGWISFKASSPQVIMQMYDACPKKSSMEMTLGCILKMSTVLGNSETQFSVCRVGKHD